MALIEKLEAIGEAIRGKTGGSELLTLDQMAAEIEGLEIGGGGSDIEDAIVQRTISGDYTNNRITKIGDYAFRACSSLASVNVANVTSIGVGAFESSNIKTIIAPLCTTLGNTAIYNCRSLTTLDVPRLVSVGTSCARELKIKRLVFEYLTTINNYGFQAASVEYFDAPLKTLGYGGFDSCKSLNTLVLRGSSLCSLGSALTGTPFASGTGYIYVPSELLDRYKAATNWATYSERFRALEDYTVDGTVTGALDESKI